VQQLGGAGEVEGLRQNLEITQVPQFHGASRSQSIAYLKGIKSDQFYIGIEKKAVRESIQELQEPDGY
jgi:hypothetical protein